VPEARQRTAIAVFAAMMGTLQLAAAVTDRKLSQQILEGGLWRR